MGISAGYGQRWGTIPLNLVREYESIAHQAEQYEEAVRRAYVELADFNDSPKDAEQNGCIICRELGRHLVNRVFPDRTIPLYWS